MARKVLFTASTWGHLVNFHLPYLRYFQEAGWEVHAACGGPAAAVPCAERSISLPFEKRLGAPENFRAAGILRRRIQAEGYELISTHTALAAFFTRLAVKGLKERPKVLNMVHGYLFDGGTPAVKRNMLLAAERWTASETDLLLTMNQWDFDAARRYRLGRRIGYIPGVGVDFSRLAESGGEAGAGGRLRADWGIPEDAFVVLYGAEFSRRKSQWVLIQAMARLPEEAVLVLAGEGALLAECRALVQSLGLSGRVLFPGHVPLGPWYRAADAVASASRSEGLPFHIMEGMYMGVPVVASQVKGHTDLIRHGENGLLCPYGDPDACAGQIRALLRDPALGIRLARRAQQDAGRYALDAVFPLVRTQYDSLFHTKAPAYAS
ncbi:glycosyltransferase [Pseudoflavonifractor sp. 524-17]|uniref:glycosyltransferase n=1 Tax=Pseudoflavonifractor sp. 524-17 TaxID=2304577 RepID=UPI00137B6AFA